MKATVVAIQAIDIPKMGFLSKTDPYLVMSISSSQTEYRTNIVEDSLSPIWNQVFEFNITDLNTDIIKVQLKDFDSIDQQKIISYCMIPLRSIPYGTKNDMWFNMIPCVDKPQGGRVRLIISIQNIYNPIQNNVSNEKYVQTEQHQIYSYPLHEQYSSIPVFVPPTHSYSSYPVQTQYVQPVPNPYIDELHDHRQSAPLSPHIPTITPQSPQTPPPQPFQYNSGAGVPYKYGGTPMAITVKRAPKLKPPAKGPKKVADWFVYPGQRH